MITSLPEKSQRALPTPLMEESDCATIAHLVPAIAPEALIIPRHGSPADQDVWLIAGLELDGVGHAAVEELGIVCGAVTHGVELRKLNDLSGLIHLEQLLLGTCAADPSVTSLQE